MFQELAGHSIRFLHAKLLLAIVCANTTVHAEVRTWTHAATERSVEAEFIEANEGTVALKRASDGKKFLLPLSELSKSDQQYVRKLDGDRVDAGTIWPVAPISGTELQDLPEGTEVVEVVSDSAQIKIGKDAIATAKKGDRFALLDRDGPWMAISFATPQGQREGWIFATDVRYAVEPGLTPNSEAPGPYEVVVIDIDKTQCAAGRSPVLFCELTLSNRGLQKITYDVANLTLQVDDKTLQPGSAGPQMTTVFEPGNGPTRLMESDFLQKGEIGPKESVTGWVHFEVPLIADPRAPLPKRWVLAGKLGDQQFEYDLLAAEIEQVGKTRPSVLDPSIEVLELGSRVNLLNVGKLLEMLAVLQTRNESFIILANNGNFFVSEPAMQRMQSQRLPGGGLPPVCVGKNQRVMQTLGFYGQGAESESAAVVRVAAMRPSSGTSLIKHLSSSSASTRATTAQSLVKSIAEPGVVEALLKAINDESPEVRAAVAGALGASKDATQVSASLVPLLDDSNARVVVAAASSLGRLKSKEAVPRLKQFAADNKHPAAANSVDALKAIGELSELEAAMRKLDLGRPSSDDFAALAKSKEERVVLKLIELLRKSEASYQIDPIAETLGEIGDSAAVEPLIEKLSKSREPSQGVAKGLGKLGDKRAIVPLQRALQSAPREGGFLFGDDFRSAAQEALVMLDAPGAMDQLLVELKQTRDEGRAHYLLKIIGRSAGERAVAPIAPFLDNAEDAELATTVLLANDSDEALEEIKKRSQDQNYRHVEEMASALSDCRSMLTGRMFSSDSPLTGIRADDPKGKRILAFFEELESSPHEEVREAVRSDEDESSFGGEFGGRRRGGSLGGGFEF